VIKACLLTLIAKGFLNLVWFIKDSLKLKYENVFNQLPHQNEETKQQNGGNSIRKTQAGYVSFNDLLEQILP
jgi:hypothetical protein